MSATSAALSEFESKKLLAEHGIPIVHEKLVTSAADAVEAADWLGYPVVLKACGPGLAHKTELGLVELNLPYDEEVAAAYFRVTRKAPETIDGVLVQTMLRGNRELVAGMTRDAQFGPCVMLGLGGIFVEALREVVFRVAPMGNRDAEDMMEEIRGSGLLGAFRGDPPVDRGLLAEILISLGELGLSRPDIAEVDINPLIIEASRPVAADALVVVS